jgi:hypothetical protein
MSPRSAVAAVFLAVACAPPETAPRPSPPHEDGYRVRIAPSLDRIDVTACFTGAREIAPQSELAREIAQVVSRNGDCTSYAVNVAQASEGADLRGALRIGDALLASPDLWLWRPEPLPSSAPKARFELPPRSSVAVAWPALGDVHRVPETTFRWASQAAFGRFDQERIAVWGGELTLSLLGGGWDGRRAEVVAWLRRAAKMTAESYGGFPVQSAQVLAVSGRGRSFGLALRGGGPTIVLRVGRGALDDDWTAVHELLHLGIPHIDLEHAWLFEGIVQYQTTLARARAGAISREQAWWELLDGFARGKRAGTGRTLAQESADMHRTRAYWRVYWAGAAIALETDVELRKSGSSLQGSLVRLARSSARAVGLSANDVIERIDRDGPGAPLRTIATRELGRSAFPEQRALLAWLGVRLDGERVSIEEAAPGGAVRDAIIPSL